MIITIPTDYEMAGVTVYLTNFTTREAADGDTYLDFNYEISEIPFFPHDSFQEMLEADISKFILSALSEAVLREHWLTDETE